MSSRCKEKRTNKAKQFLLDYCKKLKENEFQNKMIIPKSEIYSKIVIPILYSNLINIEYVSIENSNYFLNANGFLSTNVKLNSAKHDSSFSLSETIFRIFPKTYNINKCKIINTMKYKGKFFKCILIIRFPHKQKRVKL